MRRSLYTRSPETDQRTELLGRRGTTLIEVVIAIPVVLVAFGMLVQMLAAGGGLQQAGREGWISSSAGQDVIEQMHNADFRDVFRLYNADPFDDPGGPGTAPGSSFAVPGLDPLEDDPDGRAGEIVLPFWNAGTELSPLWQVREDVANVALGTPRDLNGDSMIDAADHAADYTLLPILIRLRWRGLNGPRELRLNTIISEQR